MTDSVRLTLYITGHTPRSEQAIVNLRRFCEENLGEPYELVIVDILEQPHLAEQDRIIATPTLVRNLPQPARRIIGDLSDTGRVLLGLSLPHSPKF
jgi:circadian clock protein KaiB